MQRVGFAGSVSPCNRPSAALETWKWRGDFCRAWASTRSIHISVHGWMKVHHTSFIFLRYRNAAPVDSMKGGNGLTCTLPVYSCFSPVRYLIFKKQFSPNPSNFPTSLTQRVSPPHQNSATELFSPTLQLSQDFRNRTLLGEGVHGKGGSTLAPSA